MVDVDTQIPSLLRGRNQAAGGLRRRQAEGEGQRRRHRFRLSSPASSWRGWPLYAVARRQFRIPYRVGRRTVAVPPRSGAEDRQKRVGVQRDRARPEGASVSGRLDGEIQIEDRMFYGCWSRIRPRPAAPPGYHVARQRGGCLISRAHHRRPALPSMLRDTQNP